MSQAAVASLPTESAPSRFEALYRACVADVHAYVLSLLGDRASAEDATALAFERAYRRRALYRVQRGSERAWLFGIARNAALDELRRRRRQAALHGEPVDAAALAAPEEPELVARRTAVRAALAALEPRERELVLLKFHGQLSNAELGRVLGISESNAGTRLHRAISELRRACDAQA